MTATIAPPPARRGLQTWLRRLGEAMARHHRVILVMQWTVVIFYAFLVAVPAFLELPGEAAHLWDNLTRFAQFVLWGIWWPVVIVSMMAFGRVWCGVFCPEGALSEMASRRGLGKTIPRWIQWQGWPFVAFVTTTVYGQLVSIYEYPKPALLILGGSTLAAIGIGLLYGRGTRVWCRHLCPVNGVFGLLARLAPLHFAVDTGAWRRSASVRHEPIVCAPLVDMRHMRRAHDCHMCGRCSGYREAIALAARPLGGGILGRGPAQTQLWEVLLLAYGLLGVAIGAFQWSASPWFVDLKQRLAAWLVERDALTLLQDNAPWWLLTHYPEAHDTFSWLDGLLILLYIGAVAVVLGTWVLASVYASGRLLRLPPGVARLYLAYGLTPLAGIGVCLGLSMVTLTMLKASGVNTAWAGSAHVALLALGVAWSGWLLWRMTAGTASQTRPTRRAFAWGAASSGMVAVVAAWSVLFFIW